MIVSPANPMNSNLINRFHSKEIRSAAIGMRSRGYAVLESKGAVNDWPFLIL